MGGKLYHNAFVLICYINYGYSVPLEYCLQPLNKSDCNMKPTPVFSYYKPGSRCEVEIWRGCPTANMFNDEFLCSHYCIGRLWGDASEDESEDYMMKAKIIHAIPTDYCSHPINESDCGVPETLKYTYVENTCAQVPWRGCASPNIFYDEKTCLAFCDPNPAVLEWGGEMKELPIEDINAISNILDHVIADDTEIQVMNLIIPEPLDTTTAVMTTGQADTVTPSTIGVATSDMTTAVNEPVASTQAATTAKTPTDTGSAEEVVLA